MRPLSWFGGFLVAAAVATSVGAVAHARDLQNSHTLTAARHQISTAPVNPNDPGPDPPHAVLPRSPSPTPEAASAAPVPVSSRPAAPPPPPAVVVNSTQQALINQDRASRGLGQLTWNNCLYNVALANARRIAAQGYLSHTNGPSVDLSCGLGHQAGENIGYWSGGVNDPKLNSMFMASPDHYANIMGPYNYVATAWVVASNGYGYIAVEFS
jgi:uncharacterized protein YkwD